MIYCKNCSLKIDEEDNFCKRCGAQIIRERITIKSLFSSFVGSLGWDSKFFITIRYLLYRPEIVLKEYISGTRKKYANPFSLFAIMTALSLFVFSQYSEEFIKFVVENNSIQDTETFRNLTSNSAKDSQDLKIFGYKNENEINVAWMKIQLKYYNLFAFVTLPIYTLIAFLIFRKTYNFGEHLLINTYVGSITTFLSTFLFILSIATAFNLFGKGAMLVTIIYYSFAYKKLYQLTKGQLALKILKFIGIILLFMTIPVIIGFIAGYNSN